MKRVIMSALGVLSLWALQAPVDAQTVNIFASGVVSNNAFDNTGVFGAPGGSIVGDAFTFTAIFNLADAGYFNDGQRSDIYGGQSYSYLPYDPPSLGGGVLTINGVSQAISGQWNSTLTAISDPLLSADIQDVQDLVTSSAFSENNAVTLYEMPWSGPFSYPNPVFPQGNLCATAQCDESSFAFNETLNGFTIESAAGGLSPSVITLAVSTAPEPSTWALMLIGFGATGAALRARHRIDRVRSGPCQYCVNA